MSTQKEVKIKRKEDYPANEIRKLIGEWYSGSIVVDDLSKHIFKCVFADAKKYKGTFDVDNIIQIYRKEAKEVVKSKAILSRMTRILNVAQKYHNLRALTYYDKLEWGVLESVVKLLYAMRDHKEYKKVRNKLGRVKGVTDVEYNNNMFDKVKELRKEYGVVDIDGATVVSNLEKKIDKLTDEQKRELYEWLKGKVETEDEEEVAA